jgi:uncharacterized SAM-binding protein YcdF (DUF218 family)
LSLAAFVGVWLSSLALQLHSAAAQPVDAYLVLGGSIRREIYIAQVAKQHPNIPILISQGSQDPCIWLIFQREAAPVQQIWLEKCADSTFGNFYFSVPILHEWGMRHVKLVTSPTHLPRAKWMAQILLGARGIWVEPDLVEEQGVPANTESVLKTGLDITRSLGWAVLSQFVQPECSQVVPLADINLQQWRESGFKCEHQAGIEEEDL